MNKEEKEWLKAVVKDATKHTESSLETKALIKGVSKQLDDIKESIKNGHTKYASKWTEKVIYTLMLGCMAWVGNQLLSLIPTVQALIN